MVSTTMFLRFYRDKCGFYEDFLRFYRGIWAIPKENRSPQGDFLIFYKDFSRFYMVFLVFYRDFCGFYRDFLVLYQNNCGTPLSFIRAPGLGGGRRGPRCSSGLAGFPGSVDVVDVPILI